MSSQAPLGILASRVRVEEKRILDGLDRRGVRYELVDTRRLFLTLGGEPPSYAAVLNREISHTRGVYATRLLEHHGIRTLNRSDVLETCGDKLRTTLALQRAGVPTPRTAVALSSAGALDAIHTLGYPAVIKPLVGSWGRLGARLCDDETAESVLEHRDAIPGPQNHVCYLQEYVDKPRRDIKAYVLGGEPLCAIYKCSPHWRTNTARGGTPARCGLTPELRSVLAAAADAVGGGILGIDVFEAPDGRLLVNEINHTAEFHGALEVVDVDIGDAIADFTATWLGADA